MDKMTGNPALSLIFIILFSQRVLSFNAVINVSDVSSTQDQRWTEYNEFDNGLKMHVKVNKNGGIMDLNSQIIQFDAHGIIIRVNGHKIQGNTNKNEESSSISGIMELINSQYWKTINIGNLEIHIKRNRHGRIILVNRQIIKFDANGAILDVNGYKIQDNANENDVSDNAPAIETDMSVNTSDFGTSAGMSLKYLLAINISIAFILIKQFI